MHPNIVFLPAASSSEHLLALSEVSEFTTTDMGHPYRVLEEHQLTAEMERVSNARSTGSIDSLSFQPCSPDIHENQDRVVVEEWDLLGGTWQFMGVFDGHVNDYTVDHVAAELPRQLKANLERALQHSSRVSPQRVSQLMRDAVAQLENSISSKFFDIFPRDASHLDRLSPQHVEEILEEDAPFAAVACCLGGATLVFSLVDPPQKNVWLANLGVLGLRGNTSTWNGTLLNSIHNTQTEAQRIMAEHPGEPHCIKHDRVLGFLEPSRAVGDFWLKMPSPYTTRVFAALDQDWISQDTLRRCASRILTPPYVSDIPDVYHHELPSSPWFLLLCSDGLATAEGFEGLSNGSLAHQWAQIIGAALDTGPGVQNAALSLLRAALGSEIVAQSRNLTVEMDERYMDDLSIIIRRCP
ncbi:PPM-type phosphatase domain-containing protein [Mycena chlorophos]|uniref:PPM-type phosphatase domain-containing protein n=1 Tax=Mycena chlorophos TaxID=658473 RepID=A0A8H6SFX5_MYCCL|nr:PPM-type phosphatase domain-containing protein [Mycena chlorophos]